MYGVDTLTGVRRRYLKVPGPNPDGEIHVFGTRTSLASTSASPRRKTNTILSLDSSRLSSFRLRSKEKSKNGFTRRTRRTRR